jgi:hypothetical protein
LEPFFVVCSVVLLLGAWVWWRAIHWDEEEAERRAARAVAAQEWREDQIGARCYRAGGHEWPPDHEQSCPGCECPCHEWYAVWNASTSCLGG